MTLNTSCFANHRAASLALLTADKPLTSKQAGFLGTVSVLEAISAAQREWLDGLLDKAQLPPIAG